MFIKPCTSSFFLPLHFLLLQDIDLPGGSHFIHRYSVTPYLDISGLGSFLKKANAFYKRFSSLFHMQLPLGATVKLLWMQHSVLGTPLAYIIRKHCCLNLVQTDDFNSQEVNVLRSKACCSFFIASQTAGPFRAASAQLQNVLSCLEPFQSIWTFISFHGNAEWRCWQSLNTLLQLYSNSQPSFWGRWF